MVLADILQWITTTCLIASLGVFLLRLVRRRDGRFAGTADFGAGFSAFVAGWIATELITALASTEWMGAEEILHFAVLALFATWMNARFGWALRKAREG